MIVVDALSVGRDQDQGRGRAAEARSAWTARRCSWTCKPDDKLALSVRNIPGVRLLPSNRVTARDVADTRRVVADPGGAREAAGGAAGELI